MTGGRVELFDRFVGGCTSRSYGGGVLKFFTPLSRPSLLAWNSGDGWAADWPRWHRRLTVFAHDWLGRQFAFDRGRTHAVSREPMISILEPGTGELLEIPEDFRGFLMRELIDDPDAALAAGFYRTWLESGGARPSWGQCVGYKVPLFLNGDDDVSNLELADLEVYVSLCGQLHSQVS